MQSPVPWPQCRAEFPVSGIDAVANSGGHRTLVLPPAAFKVGGNNDEFTLCTNKLLSNLWKFLLGKKLLLPIE